MIPFRHVWYDWESRYSLSHDEIRMCCTAKRNSLNHINRHYGFVLKYNAAWINKYKFYHGFIIFQSLKRLRNKQIINSKITKYRMTFEHRLYTSRFFQKPYWQIWMTGAKCVLIRFEIEGIIYFLIFSSFLWICCTTTFHRQTLAK